MVKIAKIESPRLLFLPRSIRSYDKFMSSSSPSAKKELFSEKVNNKDNIVFEDGNLQCNFNPNNFKILYVINSENCFYRKFAFTRAKTSHKAVSRRKSSDFGRWHSKWLKSNVSDSSQVSINEWFMGKCEGLVANKTIKVTKADHESTPYRTFYKYKAEIIKTSSNGPTSNTTSGGAGSGLGGLIGLTPAAAAAANAASSS